VERRRSDVTLQSGVVNRRHCRDRAAWVRVRVQGRSGSRVLSVISIISLLVIVILSVLITRIATIALTHTGLSKEAARFQARSAFSGAGFTTSESERVVNHPVRRRIILVLMLLGNAGIVTAISSLILTFVRTPSSSSLTFKIFFLVLGLVGLWVFAASPWVDRKLSHLIDLALSRYSSLDVKDYASLLHLVGEYRLAELQVRQEDWLANRKLIDSGLRDEGVIALGVKRPDGTYLGAPRGHTAIKPEDTLLLYGRAPALARLDERRKGRGGDEQHREAVAEQREVEEQEERADVERGG
jgi:hypothetical protein